MTKYRITLWSLIFTLFLWSGCGDDEPEEEVAPNEEPTLTEPTTFTVPEDISDTEVIGTLMAEDDSDTTLMFSILSNDNDLFEVDATSGELSLAAGKSLNYELDNKHEISVSVSDGELSGSIAVVINVTDVTTNNIMASFEGTNQEAFEEEGSATVTIVFDRPVLVEGATVNVVIDPGDMVYSQDYTTTPTGETGTIEVPVPLGASSVTFSLDVINDVLEEGNETITFTLAAGADDIVIPVDPAASLAFTVIDDDVGDVYLVVGKLGSIGTTLTVQSVNPTSGKINTITELTPPNADVSVQAPLFVEYTNNKLYLGYNEFTDPMTAVNNLYSVDLATGTFTLVLGDLKGAIAGFVGAGDENMQFRESYSDGTTMYIYGDVFNTMTFTDNRYLFTFDLATETFTGGTIITNSAGGNFRGAYGLGELNGSIVAFRIINGDEPEMFVVDLSTATLTSTISATISTGLQTETGNSFMAMGDNFDFKVYSGGASLIRGDESNTTLIALLDPATNEFGYFIELNDWFGTSFLQITMVQVPAAILP